MPGKTSGRKWCRSLTVSGGGSQTQACRAGRRCGPHPELQSVEAQLLNSSAIRLAARQVSGLAAMERIIAQYWLSGNTSMPDQGFPIAHQFYEFFSRKGYITDIFQMRTLRLNGIRSLVFVLER